MKVVFGFVSDESVTKLLQVLKVKKLPSRTPPIMKGLERLEMKDYCYLFINQFIETIFLIQVAYFSATNNNVRRSFDTTLLKPLTGVVLVVLPMYPMFLINDFFYYFFHNLMHHPILYPWIHKHHHRQPLPLRGYWDAANDHPLENLIGQVLIFVGIYATTLFYLWFGLKIHFLSIVLFMTCFAILAFLNHSPYDVRLPWYFLGYTVRAHETHHRFGRANYCQNTMSYDKLFKTFQPYKSGQKRK